MTLLQMSIQAGILIIGIVLIRALGMNKLPKKSFLILWDIVLIKLLVPLSFPAKWNILTFFNELQKDVGKTSASVQAEINIALADFRILPLEQLIASKTTIYQLGWLQIPLAPVPRKPVVLSERLQTGRLQRYGWTEGDLLLPVPLSKYRRKLPCACRPCGQAPSRHRT